MTTDTKGTPRTYALASVVRAGLNYGTMTKNEAMQRYYELAKEFETALATAQAELAECRRDAIDLLDEARSVYIGGCGEDLKWDKRREEFREAARGKS